MDLDEIAEELYGLHPDAFVPARDEAVARARAAGDRDLARAVGHLRRPTRAAWLANLLARQRGDQLDGLLALAGDLVDAQRNLDGGALRALSAQRRRLVGAMAREGGRLAAQAGDTATESVMRDLEGILDAALADPAVADEVRSGRLTRTVSYSGFGPAAGAGGDAATRTARQRPGDRGAGAAPGAGRGEGQAAAGSGETSAQAPAGATAGSSERERAERERAERERAARERAERELAEAEEEESAARGLADEREAARVDAEAVLGDAKARVADLAAELDAAREQERTAASAARSAGAAAKDAAREASAAASRVARARARVEDLPHP